MSTASTLRFEPIVRVDGAVWRQRVLDQMLDAAPASARLTLLSAPAGFGKTTVLAQLASQAREHGATVVWLNCDERDKDPTMFARNLVAALTHNMPGAAQEEELSLPERLATLQKPLLICIDDYERASGAAVDGVVEQLARVAPTHLSIVLSSREAPRHHLTRLQLAGNVRLVDAELLRFDRAESLALLGDALPELVAQQLAAYADGWAFALQLARLRASGGGADGSMATHLGPTAPVKIPRRQIFDYLANEVLAKLPAALMGFLRDVAMLEFVDVPVANALRERNDSFGLIRQLTSIRPLVLVDEQSWTARLHPLLRDYLMDALELTSPGYAPLLHARAARYLAAHGRLHEAVGHAVAAGRLDLGADLIEAAGAFRLVSQEGEVRVRLLLQQLPEATLRRRPRLRLLQLMVQALSGGSAAIALEFERLEQQIRDADTGSDDEARFDLELVRCVVLINASGHSLRFSPWSVLDQSTRLARAHSASDERLVASVVPIEVFFLHRYGPIDRCERRVREMELIHAHGAYTYNSPWISMYHVWLAMAQGDLALAERSIRQSLHQDANFLNFGQDSLSQMAIVMLARAAWLRGDVEAAREHLSALPTTPIPLLEIQAGRWVDMARCQFALGHADQALALLQEARQLAFEDNLPQLEALAGAVHAELLARMGDRDGAQVFAQRIKLEELWAMACEPFAMPWILVEALARAKYFILVLEGEAHGAGTVASVLLGLARGSGFRLTEMSALLMAARASEMAGDSDDGQRLLSLALALGLPCQVDQLLLDFGAELMTQIRVWLSGPVAKVEAETSNWAQRLLQTWEQRFRARAQGSKANLLTPREVDVLCELARDHSTKLIAKNLALSPETVKHHLKAIFSKLGARSREDAVLEARKRALMP